MDKNRFITVAAGLAAFCCPTWARAACACVIECSKRHCSCVAPVGFVDGSCESKKIRQHDFVLLRECVALSCECGLFRCRVKAAIASTAFGWVQGRSAKANSDGWDRRGLKQPIAEFTEALVVNHNRRQAFLGVWLK